MHSNELNLTDGHAYHEMPDQLVGVIDRLPELWHRAQRSTLSTIENDFRAAWCHVAGTPSLADGGGMRLCPTASNALDIVAAWCRAGRLRVGLVEPTFDNLALLFRRREVPLVPLDLPSFAAAAAVGTLDEAVNHTTLDALLIVNPNNPTGEDLGPESFAHIARWCQLHDITLITDNTFRHYRREPFDDAAITNALGCRYISIEDTGKTWPTLDSKVSALFFSSELMDLHEFYEEQYLCTSGATVVMMTEILEETARIGLQTVVWELIDRRRAQLRQALSQGPLTVAPESVDSLLPVEWVDSSAVGPSQATAERIRRGLGVHVLPGDNFFWARHRERGDAVATEFSRLRLSLCKPERAFTDAVTTLGSVLLNEVLANSDPTQIGESS